MESGTDMPSVSVSKDVVKKMLKYKKVQGRIDPKAGSPLRRPHSFLKEYFGPIFFILYTLTYNLIWNPSAFADYVEVQTRKHKSVIPAERTTALRLLALLPAAEVAEVAVDVTWSL